MLLHMYTMDWSANRAEPCNILQLYYIIDASTLKRTNRTNLQTDQEQSHARNQSGKVKFACTIISIQWRNERRPNEWEINWKEWKRKGIWIANKESLFHWMRSAKISWNDLERHTWKLDKFQNPNFYFIYTNHRDISSSIPSHFVDRPDANHALRVECSVEPWKQHHFLSRLQFEDRLPLIAFYGSNAHLWVAHCHYCFGPSGCSTLACLGLLFAAGILGHTH